MKKIVFLIFIICIQVNIFAYTDEDEVIDKSIYDELNSEKVEEKTPRPSFGGWIIPRYIDLKQGENDFATFNNTVKIWSKLNFTNDIYVYLRIKDVYWTELTDSEDINEDSSKNVFDLDIGFIKFNMFNDKLNLYLGRKYFLLGTGITMNGRADGAELNLFSSIADLKLFGSYTGLLNKDSNPYGLSSREISDGSKRIFAGANISKTFYNQEIFAYYLYQKDNSSDAKDDISKYDSQYYSLGLKGIVENASYFGEYVYQTGKESTTESSVVYESDIKSFAVNSGIQYFFSIVTKPTLFFNYTYASGDKERTFGDKSPLGNLSDQEDSGFIGFGTFAGGNALRPKISNIQVFKGGLSMLPFDFARSDRIKFFNIIGSYYYYKLNETANDSKNLGQAFDLSFRWKLFADLSFFADYGLFLPDDGYGTDADNIEFYSAGLFLNF